MAKIILPVKKILPPTLVLLAMTMQAQSDTTKAHKHTPQYDKKITFDLSLEPTTFFDVAGKSATVEDYNGTFLTTVTNKIHPQQYGGMDLSLGMAIWKRFHFNFLSGISCSNGFLWIPAGVDFRISLTKARVAPFIHFGGGYICGKPYSLQTYSFDYSPQFVSDNGAFASIGLGVYIKATSKLSITISPDYRFIYSRYRETNNAFSDDVSLNDVGLYKNLIHQVALKLALIFY